MARRTKRLRTDEEKRSTCFRTSAPGVSVAKAAPRCVENATLVFKWLRDPRYPPDSAALPSPGLEPRYLPQEIVAEVKAPMAVLVADGHIEIDLADGHRKRISGTNDPEAPTRLIRGLTA